MLWLWHRAAATALIRPLAGEPPCAVGAALKKKKKKKKKKNLTAVAQVPNRFDPPTGTVG